MKRVLSVSMMVFELDECAVTLALALALALTTLPDAAAAWMSPAGVVALADADAEVLTVGAALVLALEWWPELEPE